MGIQTIKKSVGAKIKLAKTFVRATTALLHSREKKLTRQALRDRALKIHDVQSKALEDSLAPKLAPLFKKQIEDAAAKLRKQPGYSRSDPSGSLLKSIYNPRDYDEEFINRALPPIAQAMAEAMMAQAIQFHGDLKRAVKKGWVKCGGPGSGVPGPCPTGQSLTQEEKKVALEKLSKLTSIPNQFNSQDIVSSSEVFLHPHVGMHLGFSQSDLKKKVDVEIDVKHLIPTQDYIPREGLKAYIEKQPNELPAVIKVKGPIGKDRIFVNSGHTRIGAQILAGRTKVKVSYYEFDETAGKPSGMFGRPPGAFVSRANLNPPKSFYPGTKASTASEWLNNLDPEDAPDLEDVVFTTPYGKVTMRLATDYPDWMKEKIQERLDETFSQPYWKDINDTTGGHIETLLKNGLENGVSIEGMADQMLEDFGADYPLSRGRNIARTEAGNALNGARSDAIDGLINDLGLQDSIKKLWLSILGNTTRDTHAHLDGVPASSDGTWALGGVRARWPGDTRLPAGERCNCQCSVVAEIGMQNDEAADRIADYDLRVQAAKEFQKSFK